MSEKRQVGLGVKPVVRDQRNPAARAEMCSLEESAGIDRDARVCDMPAEHGAEVNPDSLSIEYGVPESLQRIGRVWNIDDQALRPEASFCSSDVLDNDAFDRK